MDLLNSVQEEEMSDLVFSAKLCTCGPANGLSRSSHSLASAATTQPALPLTKKLAEDLLRPFEAVRRGTEVFFHNVVGHMPHGLEKDARRLRLNSFQNHTFHKWRC